MKDKKYRECENCRDRVPRKNFRSLTFECLSCKKPICNLCSHSQICKDCYIKTRVTDERLHYFLDKYAMNITVFLSLILLFISPLSYAGIVAPAEIPIGTLTLSPSTDMTIYSKNIIVKENNIATLSIASNISMIFGDGIKWNYTKDGHDIILSSVPLVRFDGFICHDDYIVSGEGLAQKKIYPICVSYPSIDSKNISLSFVQDNAQQFTVSWKNAIDPIITSYSSGLVLYQPFDNISEMTSFYDYSGNNNTGLCSSCPVVFSNGKVNGAVYSDGLNHKEINYTDTASLRVSSNFTINLWAKMNGSIDGNEFLVWESGGTDDYALFYDNKGSDTDSIGTGVDLSGGSAFVNINTGINRSQSWEMITARYNGTHLSIFRNGSQSAVTTASGTVTYAGGNSDNRLRILADVSINFYLQGALDEIAIWNIALSASQISQLYNGGNGTSLLNISSGNITNITGGYNTTPSFSSLSPLDNTDIALNISNVTFSAFWMNASNISIYIGGVLNDSTLSNGNATIEFTKELTIGSYVWYMNASNINGNNETPHYIVTVSGEAPASASYTIPKFTNDLNGWILAGLIFMMLSLITFFFEVYVRISVFGIMLGVFWIIYFFMWQDIEMLIEVFGIIMGFCYTIFSLFRD